MQDFNSYSNSYGDNKDESLFKRVSSIAKNFDGKSQEDLYKAVLDEAKKGKTNGTLSNSDLDNFAKTLSPLLDDKKKKIMYSLVEELKKL